MAFAGYLKQSTAVDILIGPFIDDSDGKTAETGLTLDVEVSKNGQALANKSDATAPSHDAAGTVDGYYNCELDTTDTGTLGILTVVAHAAGFLPVRLDYQIVTANWWDTMCSTDQLDVNVTNIEGSDPTDQIRDAVVDDATRLDASSLNAIEGKVDTLDTNVDAILVDTAELQTDDIPGTLSTIEGKVDTVDTNVDAILVDTAELQTDDVPGLIAALNDVSTADINAQCDATIETYHLDHLLAADYDPSSKPGVATALLNELVENDGGLSRFTENALEQAPSGTGASAATIADAVWDEAAADHVAGGSFGAQAGTDIDAILADTNELQTDDIPGALSTIEGKVDTVDTNVDAILVDTAELQTDDIPGALSTIEGKVDTVDGKVDTVDGNVDAILVDTAELQTDDIPGTLSTIEGKVDTVDGNVDAILVDTAELQTDDIPGTLSTIDGKIDTVDGNVDSILADTGTDGVVLANNAITAAKIATDAIAADEIAAAAANKIADHVIRRTFQNACDSANGDGKTGRSLLGAIAKLVNKVSISGSTLTVTEDDDSTGLFTQSITTDAAADPIIGLDT